MTEIIVKILIELLPTISLAIQQAKQGRISEPHLSDMTFSNLENLEKKLLAENGVEAVLQRLDRLMREEAQTTATQRLELVYGLTKNIKVVTMDGARGLFVSLPLY
jgi:hypothetical protein